MTYTDINKVKLYLSINSEEDDTLLNNLIDYAQSYINTYTSRQFEGISETRLYDESFIYDDFLNIRDDICVVTNILNGAGTSVEYSLSPSTPPYYAIKLKPGYTWSVTKNPIEVTGVFAYSSTPPEDIIYCATRLVGYFYHLKDSQVFDVSAMPELGVIQLPKGIPQDVRLLLDKYQKMVTF